VSRCATCALWGYKDMPPDYNWDGRKVCQYNGNLTEIGGGDNNDSLYTSPDFGCVAHEPLEATDATG
jgi:hypothetical protein